MRNQKTVEHPIEKLFDNFEHWKKWGAVLFAGVVALLLAAIVIIIVLISSRGKLAAEESKEPLLEWPEIELTEGIPQFPTGTFRGGSTDDGVVRLFYEDVSADALAAYMKSSGLSFSEKAPYIASVGDRLIILTRNGAGDLSIVIAETKIEESSK